MENRNDDLTWQEVKTEHVVCDEYIDFRKSDFQMPDGKIYGPYYTYSRRDYCIIVALDEDGNELDVWLVEFISAKDEE